MKVKLDLRGMILSAIFAAMISLAGYVIIPLPFTPVPITGQSFAIMLAGLTLTTLEAGLSVGVYILLGIVGLPVFSGGASGIAVIIGPKGGYVIGFLAAVIVIALIRRKSNHVVRLAFAGFTGGILVVYTLGVLWLSHMNHLALSKAFVLGALPFIPGDIIKLVAAVIIALAVNRQLKAILQR